MNTLSTRLNGQADYRPINQNRAAWREEMLDDLLNNMRDKKLPQPIERQLNVAAQTVPGKGYYIDLYV